MIELVRMSINFLPEEDDAKRYDKLTNFPKHYTDSPAETRLRNYKGSAILNQSRATDEVLHVITIDESTHLLNVGPAKRSF